MILLAFMIPGQVTFIPVYLMMADWGLVKTLAADYPFISNAFGIFLCGNISCRFRRKSLKRPALIMRVNSKSFENHDSHVEAGTGYHCAVQLCQPLE